VTALLTPDEIERGITETIDALDRITTEYADLAEQAAECEADYRLRHASTIIRLKDLGEKMTDKETEARATVAAASEFRSYRLSSARLDASKQCVATYRVRLDALRTLAASARYAAGPTH